MPDEPKKGVPGGWSRPDPSTFDPDEFGEEPDPPFEWKTDESPAPDATPAGEAPQSA